MGAHGNVRVCPGWGRRRSGHEPKILNVPDFHNLIYALILVTGIGGWWQCILSSYHDHQGKLISPPGLLICVLFLTMVLTSYGHWYFPWLRHTLTYGFVKSYFKTICCFRLSGHPSGRRSLLVSYEGAIPSPSLSPACPDWEGPSHRQDVGVLHNPRGTPLPLWFPVHGH